MNDSDITKPGQDGENTSTHKPERSVPPRPVNKKDPRRVRKSTSSNELSRQRVKRSVNHESTDVDTAKKKTRSVTAVSEVRKKADPPTSASKSLCLRSRLYQKRQ